MFFDYLILFFILMKYCSLCNLLSKSNCKTASKISLKISFLKVIPLYQMSVWLQITNMHTEISSRKSALCSFWFKLSLCLIHSCQTKHVLNGNRTFHRLCWMLLNKSNRRTQSRKRHICRCINVLNPQSVLIYGEPLQTFTGQIIQI